jgi:hypothetical protein
MLPALPSFLRGASGVSVQKNTPRKTARPNARAKHNRPKRALAQFKRVTHRSPKPRTEKIGQISAAELRAAFDGPPAQYDIDAVEAHVAQLAEQAWSWPWGPRLRAYAVAWAMGLNELMDPEGTQCEHLTMEVYTEQPDSYEAKFDKLASSVAQEFARLARIPATEQNQFLLDVTDQLASWIARVNWYSNRRDFMNCLKKTKRSAAALYRELEGLRLKESEYGDLDSSLMPSVISCMLHYLPALINGIRRTLPDDEQQGRPRGCKQYPGLAHLTSNLEFLARWRGGGFGFPNKKLQKGRLIQALDWLRAFLARENDWSWLAPFLPTPGQHPSSVYESAVIGVNKLHITRGEIRPTSRISITKVENESEAKVENIDPAEVRRIRAMANSMRYIMVG